MRTSHPCKNGCGPGCRSRFLSRCVECIGPCWCSKVTLRQRRPPSSAARVFLQSCQTGLGPGGFVSMNQSACSSLINDFCYLAQCRISIFTRRRLIHQYAEFLQYRAQPRPSLTIQQSSFLILTERLFRRRGIGHNKPWKMDDRQTCNRGCLVATKCLSAAGYRDFCTESSQISGTLNQVVEIRHCKNRPGKEVFGPVATAPAIPGRNIRTLVGMCIPAWGLLDSGPCSQTTEEDRPASCVVVEQFCVC